jgi:hypothetical protein
VTATDWRIFDALTCDTPALNDIRDWMLRPHTDSDLAMQKSVRAEHALAVELGKEIIIEVEP